MQGMIGHHAQAVVMATMAPTHGASAQIKLFATKILRSQRDEIELMQSWLRDRGAPVPDSADAHAGMHMNKHSGTDKDMHASHHAMLMPGMLTAEQLAQLDQARGPVFDRLFLTFMIQHHEGALTMVAKLFDTAGSLAFGVAFVGAGAVLSLTGVRPLLLVAGLGSVAIWAASHVALSRVWNMDVGEAEPVQPVQDGAGPPVAPEPELDPLPQHVMPATVAGRAA